MTDSPPAPWRLVGEAWAAATLVDLGAARRAVPAGLRVISPWPGCSLGILYLARYGPESTLSYHELIAIPALCWHAGRVGAWVSRIWVDDPRSQAGGREIWGLPKELACFQWGPEGARVLQDGRVLCEMRAAPAPRGIRVPLALPAFGLRGSSLLHFTGRGTATAAWAPSAAFIAPRSSPLAGLFPGAFGRTVHLADLSLRVPAPVAAGTLDEAPL